MTQETYDRLYDFFYRLFRTDEGEDYIDVIASVGGDYSDQTDLCRAMFDAIEGKKDTYSDESLVIEVLNYSLMEVEIAGIATGLRLHGWSEEDAKRAAMCYQDDIQTAEALREIVEREKAEIAAMKAP